MSVKRWSVSQPDNELAARLAEECEIHPFLSLLLTTRGIGSLEEASDFLLGGDIGDDPYAFADMDAAVERVQRAIDRHEKIAVYGDYDADGVTSTALLYTYLTGKGADVRTYIPERDGEGYGLHAASVEALAREGVQLIVTVDNGIAALEEAELAARLGVDLVITDHHQPQDTLPRAVAVVDPHRADCGSEFKEYAGVGVAFKLVCALEGDPDAVLEEFGDLVAIGTLADVMPLREENRKLVRRGLQVLAERKRPGLARLAEAAGMGEKRLTASAAVFTLAPRLNAAGRMGSPETAARLLMAEDDGEAKALADDIQRLNTERQTVEAAILKELLERLRTQPEATASRILVLEGENWHQGVVGILAARLLELTGKPCLVLSVEGKTAKGSGRSLPGFSLFEALSACRDVLQAFGGHSLAAGVTLDAARIPELRERLNAAACQMAPTMPVPELKLDFRLRPSQIDVEKLELLNLLEPCGAGNPAPVFGLFQMRLDAIAPVGGGKHLRLTFSRDGTSITAMKFQTPPEAFPVPCGAVMNLAVTLEKNEYRGVVSPSIIIKDIRYASTKQEDLLEGLDAFGRILRREFPLEDAPLAVPSRDSLSRLYRFFRAARRWQGTLEQLYPLIDDPEKSHLRLLVGLQVFRETGLLAVDGEGERLCVGLLPAVGKADLNAAPVLRYLNGSSAE